MRHSAKSVRTFIGSKDYGVSSAFYKDLGFEEHVISKDMSYFNIFDTMGFYLQDYYEKDWVNNTMLFLEVDDVDRYWNEIQALNLPDKYMGVRFVPIRNEEWGREFFMHDPAGVLWHFGEFKA